MCVLAPSCVGGSSSSGLFDHLPDVWSQRFHFGSIRTPRGPTPPNKNLPPPLRSNQWAIRFPLISLAGLDVDVNQSHIWVMVFLLIASLRSGCIPFRLWSLSANEVRKAYGSCYWGGTVGKQRRPCGLAVGAVLRSRRLSSLPCVDVTAPSGPGVIHHDPCLSLSSAAQCGCLSEPCPTVIDTEALNWLDSNVLFSVFLW